MGEVQPCVECGTETPREEMFGPPDSLRCAACAQQIRDRMMPGVTRKLVREWPPVVTGILIAASVIATMIHEYGDRELIAWMYPLSRYANGEIWRHLTSTVIHGGPIHLIFNMYWFWYFGKVIEGRWGPHGMLLLWVVFGFASSAVQWTFTDYGSFGIGMSGVLYALFGMAFVLRKTKDYAAQLAHPQVVQVLLGWFVLCFFIGQIWNIGNAAHAGGLAAGALLGWAIDSKYRALLVPAAYLVMVGIGVGTIWIDRMPIRLS